MAEHGIIFLATQFINMVLDAIEGSVIEVGIGRFTTILGQAASKYDSKFIGCDMDASTCLWSRSTGCSAHHGSLFDFSKKFNGKAAVVFLDGEECGDHLKRIFEVFWEKLVPGGLIIVHNFVTVPNVELQAMLEMGKNLNRIRSIRVFFFYRDANNEEMLLVMRDI